MEKKITIKLFVNLVLLASFLLILSPVIHAQNWVELPPYNTLWPLWSPALSPVDDVTGLPTPLVSSLAASTQLPVTPGLTWDPSMPYPWLLYNTFSGLAYFDPLAGINLWPAPSLLDNAGLPAPIGLPADYANLPPTDATWLVDNVFTANLYYRLYFPSVPFTPPTGPTAGAVNTVLASLLTPLDILGPTLGVPSVLAPVVPPPPTIAPTPILPPPTLPIPTVPVPTLVAPTAAVSQIVANQVGTWQGLWSTGLVRGQMTLNLVEDPIFNTLAGYVQLLGNPTLGSLVEVTGEALNNQVYVSGSGIGLGGMTFTIDVVGTLTAPDAMSGTYTLINGTSLVETGSFQLALVTPVIPVPAPVAVAPAPTVPVPIAPAPTVIAPPPTLPIPTVPVPTLVAPTAAISQIVANQVGTWQGIWSTGLVSGQMTLNLVQDIIFNTLVGYVQLLGNPTLGSLVDVTGEAVNNQVYVSGSGIGLGTMTFVIDVVGTLTAPDAMSGTYTLTNSGSLVETGSFELSLIAPVI
ncbi:MAG: hypothetical protein ACMUJM_12385 [bacterium]